MFGKIYRKLYVWFLIIFVLTIAVVSMMIHAFYTERVRDELQGQLRSHAQFLMDQYKDACKNREAESCREFLDRLRRISPLRFWITNRSGKVILSNQYGAHPVLKTNDLAKAADGEPVITMRHRAPPYVIIPITKSDGTVEELAVVERGFVTGRRFSRFPVFASLIIVLITIGILIYPLSKRLTRPVSELHRLGQEWAEGHLENRAIIRGKDEISELAGTFNTMAGNLQRILEQRKEFLALISHELKSPLTRMRIAVELLVDQNQGKIESEKLLNKIQREILESEQLIEQLLVLSKIEMNAPLSNESFPLEKVTRKAIEQVAPVAHRAGVEFREHGAAVVKADFQQLERAMINILENAVKFSPSGSRVLIEIEQAAEFALWKCSDEGAGIRGDEAEKIFQPFYRGSGANEKEGTGLGLFIARRIVEMHRGTIHAEQNDPRGLTIVIKLPLQT